MGCACLALVASLPATAGAVVETVPPSAVVLDELRHTEPRELDPRAVRVLELADRLARDGVKYRRLRADRRLSRDDLAESRPRLSCSELVWTLFSLAGLDMGEHPVGSRRLAGEERPYPRALVRVRDGSIRAGDVLVYAYPTRERRKPGEVGHVVIVVSAERRIVVGSHGRESTARGERRGVGYRRLPEGWERWSHGRTLQAVYRMRPDGA